ncbi:universal stress protein [Puerhibacterium sp. TATVAM-FAB25]|uniref:universal stress protein n=1 Tax=Puerhibacterium sp. TATVAM-FAB25 TaxID=3093699 RepID=UPI00397D7509
MLVSEVMTTPARVITRDVTVEQALRRFRRQQVTAMPVVDGLGHLVGIVSEADLLRAGVAPEPPAEADHVAAPQAVVGGVMTRRVKTVSPHDDVAEVAHAMGELGIRSMPVLSRSRVVGMVARSDVDGHRSPPTASGVDVSRPGHSAVRRRSARARGGGIMSAAWSMGVVVGVDGSAASRHALEWAVNTAARHGGSVVAVAASEGPRGPVVPGATAGARPDAAPELRERAEQAVASLPGAPEPGERVEVRVEPGTASRVLASYSRTADLVVVGRGDGAGAERAARGSTSRTTAATSHGRVAVVPPGAGTSTPDHVVVGVGNFDEDPTPVLELAFDEARAGDRPVRLVHVIDPHVAFEAGTGRRGYAELWHDIATHELGALLERWSDKYPDVERTVSVRPGEVGAVLLDEVTERDLLVVGGRRHPAPAGRLLGSVPDALVRMAQCPVVVVHGGPGR